MSYISVINVEFILFKISLASISLYKIEHSRLPLSAVSKSADIVKFGEPINKIIY